MEEVDLDGMDHCVQTITFITRRFEPNVLII
jgi:hypothetical protein